MKYKRLLLKSSFTLIELLVVIVIIGIIVSTLSFNFAPNNLQLAANQIISDIRFTQSLALKDDKYQPFPNNNSTIEQNRSKYWFKQWWQIRFSTFKQNDETHYWYEIFSDIPDKSSSKNFTGQANLPTTGWYKSIAKDPLTGELLIGHCGVSQYPDCNETNTKLDLTNSYGIKDISYTNFDSHTKRLVFDNLGNIFLKEGKDGDAGDINPLDEKNRSILITTAKIQLCLDNPCKKIKNRCIQINITPSANLYKSNCE